MEQILIIIFVFILPCSGKVYGRDFSGKTNGGKSVLDKWLNIRLFTGLYLYVFSSTQ